MDLLSSVLIFFQFGSSKICAITESPFYHAIIIFSLFIYDTKSNKKKTVLCMSSVGIAFVKTELLTSQTKKVISSPEINATVFL